MCLPALNLLKPHLRGDLEAKPVQRLHVAQVVLRGATY